VESFEGDICDKRASLLAIAVILIQFSDNINPFIVPDNIFMSWGCNKGTAIR
jgi:hypothetical protein